MRRLGEVLVPDICYLIADIPRCRTDGWKMGRDLRCSSDAHSLRERFFDLGGEFEGEGVEALGEFADVLEKIVVGDEGGDGGEEAGGGGDEGFGDAGRDGAEAGGAGSAEAGEGVDDAPDGAEKADERGDAGGGGEPGHAFFGAANFFGGGELHADGYGLHGFEFGGRGIAGAGDLGLKFAIAGGVDIGEGRAGGNESLGIGDAFCGAEDFQELIALAADAAEEAGLLEDEGPGDEGCKQKNG
jgi:hypothetical protein